MILRRLAEAINGQNWFTVLLEVLIVVVGIFIGLQVDDWNQGRKDRILEKEYLERLYADMAGSIEDHDDNSNWDSQRNTTQEIAIAALRAGVLTDEDKEDFARGLLLVGVHNPLRRRWGTVEELQSTGNILLLRDLKLRDMIAQTGAYFERNSRVVDAQMAQIVQSRSEVLKRVFPVTVGFETDSPIEADYDFDALANDAEFINAFAGAHMSSRIVNAFIEDHMIRIKALQDKLADDLGIDVEASE